MSKITYYPTMFHTNPFSFNMIEFWEANDIRSKELILQNGRAKELGISKMMLNVTKFSVLDSNGKEIIQNNFPKHVELNSKGMDTEFFVRAKTGLQLEEGTYTTFRFYLGNSENYFIYDDRSKNAITHKEYLDFEIKNGFVYEGIEDLRVQMRFDLAPFTFMSNFGSLQRVFQRSKRTSTKMVEGLSSYYM